MTNLESLKQKAIALQTRALAAGQELAKSPKVQKLLTDPKLLSAYGKTVALGNTFAAAARTQLTKLKKA